MNNRYICKAKRKANGEWIIGYLVKYNERYYIYYEYADEMCQTGNYLSYKEVIPETVCRCTELKDMNGKLMFEGDIVVSKSDRRLSDRPRLIKIDIEKGCNYCAARRKPVVIGNIHDNPELLENMVAAQDKASAIAEKALEKQIPRKPKMDNDNGIYETEHCPLCNRKLFPNEHHCKCGQALDWSDTE